MPNILALFFKEYELSLFSKLLKKILPPPKLTECERFLFVGPHPDDIEIGAGATVARLTGMNKQVKFLICTDGRYGTEDPDMDLNELVKVRQGEAIAAAKHLGVNEVQFLPFPDGGAYDRYDLTKEIAKVICEYKPDIIFAPDPKLISELHIDHINAGEAASNAFIMSSISRMMEEMGCKSVLIKGIAYYFTDRPNQYIVTKKLINKQFDALMHFKSQFPIGKEGENLIKNLKQYMKFRSIRFGLRKFKSGAEGFRVLGAIHTHCAPESAEF